MARGTREIDLWAFEVSRLRTVGSRFRMVRKKGKPFIYVREVESGKVVQEFSSGRFRHDLDEHVRQCAEECLVAHKRGRWTLSTATSGSSLIEDMGWFDLAERARANLRARVAREGSRKNAEGHLTEIGKIRGPITANRLKKWALERDPIAQPSAFRNRLETLSHIDKAGDLDLKPLIAELKAKRPTGAAKKEQERRTQQIRVIPDDLALEAWLDRLDGHVQWTFAMISTYGLRPSEAWHITDIDADGWATIPGEGATKTETHFARPVPERWVERYKLRDNLAKYQAELQERWPVRWEDRGGLRIPLNNSQVSNSLYQELENERIPRLTVDSEWLRPYDLRHSYAIRCEGAEELAHIPSEEFARYLGHGFEVHKRIYLKHMSPDRQKAASKVRGRKQESPAAGAELPADVLEKLAKLEQLEALLKG